MAWCCGRYKIGYFRIKYVKKFKYFKSTAIFKMNYGNIMYFKSLFTI